MLVPAVLVTALDFFVPDRAAPRIVEVQFGVSTVFEPSNQIVFTITRDAYNNSISYISYDYYII